MARISYPVLLVVAFAASAGAVVNTEETLGRANPIRKVVTLLQNMQKKVSSEGEKAEELYEKFMCYCKNGMTSLRESVEAAGTKTAELESEIKASEEALAQTKDTLKTAQSDRSAAKTTMSEATAMREKEAATFAQSKSDYEADIASVTKATKAIESGASGSFLQTGAAQALQRLLMAQRSAKLTEYDRNQLLSFLSGKQDYAPASGEIIGILKTMSDEMTKTLADLTAAENDAVKEYESLMAAKTKEVAALSKKVETKLEKVGDLGISIAQMKTDLGDTGEALLEDKKFLQDMEKSCKTKTAEYEADSKLRTQELAALADTIKILNDDDALELFKKTLPAPSASLLEVASSRSEQSRAHALMAISAAKRSASGSSRPALDFIALVLKGKKIGFDKVIKMIDEMIGTLKKEQVDDDSKKTYCASQFDSTDDKKKSLEQNYKDVLTVIANTEEGIASTKDEIAALAAGIKKLDKAVMEATEQRKEENSEYKALMASDAAAKELLKFAKNRLNKFYNPKLYKAPPKAELSAEGRIAENMGAATLVQISSHHTGRAPPPPPESFEAYSKKSGESGGVIGMIDLLIKDLDEEMTAAETAEKDSQMDYESFLKDSQEKRTEDSKMLTDKESTLGSLEGQLLKAKDTKKSTAKELSATMKFISSLHAECDWLMQYFDVRKEARTSEIDALGKAKAVLSGADVSLLQNQAARYLRH